MRHHRSHHHRSGIVLITAYLLTLLPSICGIMVPTGKLTPIKPAEPSLPPVPIPLSARKLPAPVHEYTAENPEPAPLDPSYVPIQLNYIQYLSPHAIVFVPLKFKNPSALKFDKYKTKYDKREKLPDHVLQKYQEYPINLQKKYIQYYLTQSNNKV